MNLNCASSPENPPATDQTPVPPIPSRRSRKKIFAIVGTISVAAVVLALMLMFLIPPSVGETIPLSYNYTPREEMTYNITMTGTSSTGQNISTPITESLSISVISFDGENYTINQTATIPMPSGAPISYSVTIKMNKTGYSTNLNSTSGFQSPFSMFGSVWPFGQKTEAKVGETIQVPLNETFSSYSLNGTVTLKFGEIQNITVPAGEYRVFKIDISSGNISMVVNSPASFGNVSISEIFSFNGQTYLEYGTCRLVESQLQETMAIQTATMNSTQDISMQMILVHHVKG
jgi:hypothetical protein